MTRDLAGSKKCNLVGTVDQVDQAEGLPLRVHVELNNRNVQYVKVEDSATDDGPFDVVVTRLRTQ
jgi:hypothetical protein